MDIKPLEKKLRNIPDRDTRLDCVKGWLAEHGNGDDPTSAFELIDKVPYKGQPITSNWRERIISHDQLLKKDIPEIAFCIEGLFPLPGLCAIAGKKKIGKSFLMSQLAQCKAGGTPFLGIPTNPGNVLYLALEDGERRLKARLNMQNTVAGLPITYLYKIRALNTIPGMLEFKEMLQEIKPVLVIIDTFKAAVNGKLDENEAGGTGDLFNKLHELSILANTTIIIVMHHGKPKAINTEMRDAGFDIRGSSALPGATDCNLSLYKNPDGTFDLLAEGRDIPEKELRLSFDREVTWTWINKGDAQDARRDEAEKKILEAIFTLGDRVDAQQVADEAGISRVAAQIQLKRMRECDLVGWEVERNGKTKRILYSVMGGNSNE